MNSTGIGTGAVPTIKCEDTSPSPCARVTDGEGVPGPGGSYNLSVNVNLSAAVSNLLAAESGGNTPRTPEILNSLIAMSNPLEQYNFNEKNDSGFKGGSGNDSNSSMSNGSSATSPASGTPQSIQKTCSELIKAGLKLSIESKRKMSTSDTESCVKRLKKEESDEDYDSSHTMTKSEGLTPEDEERRRRRRERNKIAATKCRLKKRERTVNLVSESEQLENQNIDLKSQLKDLEVQRRQLVDMLSLHTASCVKNNNGSPNNAQYNIMRAYDAPTPFPTSYDASSPYIRPESANVLASSYTCVTLLNGDSAIDHMSLENPYMTQQLMENEYHRPDSVLSLPPNAETNYVTTDGYLTKATTLQTIEQVEPEYYDHEVNYNMTAAQQCHTYPSSQDTQNKLNNGLNDVCLV